MCGIAGIYSARGAVDPAWIGRMLDAISHRGPDDHGAALFDGAGGRPPGSGESPRGDLALGHRRLSILDLSSAGRQPMSTPEGDLWITYNGEVFNFPELKMELEGRGYRFRSATDTEALLYAYREFGEPFIERLRGFFAFAIFDRRKKTLFMARDRLGLKPFKYFWDGQRFAFASELKAILALPWVPRKADREAIDRYLALRYVPAPLTGVEGVRKLPAGCSMTLRLDGSGPPEIRRYWAPRFAPKDKTGFEEAKARTLELLADAVRVRLLSDVPLGVFLSGGLDSSAIVAVLRRHYSGEIRTFSVGFGSERFDERPYAREVAARYSTLHTELVVEPRPSEDLKKIVWHFDEPFGDPSAIPSFYLSKAASTEVKTILNGDGGDELFAGYKRYRIHARNRALSGVPGFLKAPSRRLLAAVPAGVDKKSGWGKAERLLEAVSGSYLDNYMLRFSGLSAKMREALYEGSSMRVFTGWPAAALELARASGAEEGMEELMALDQSTYLPDDILVKSDLSGMAHSLENRSPLLDQHLVEWVNRLPSAYKAEGASKRILKEALRGELPEGIIDRKKAGFSPPINEWMRGCLAPEARRCLASGGSPLKGFSRAFSTKMLDAHSTGAAELGEPIWLLVALANWLEVNGVKMD